MAMASVGMAETATEGEREIDLASYACLILMVLIGSGSAPAAKFAVRELPIGLLPLLRFGGAGLILLPLVWKSESFRRMLRESFGLLVLTAAFCVPINQFFLLNGARLAPTSHVGVIYAACPLVVLLLAWVLGQERLFLGRLTGILASVSGVLVIGLGNLWQADASGLAVLKGDVLLIGAVVSWGAYMALCKPLLARYEALPVLAGTFLLGSLLHLPIAAATYPTWTPLSGASGAAWRGVAYMTLAVSVLGLAFQNQALRRLDASQVATFGNAAPVLTVFWGIWLLDEPITPTLAVGGLLTLGGILWAGRPEYPAREPAAQDRGSAASAPKLRAFARPSAPAEAELLSQES
jgi:drug/metabolite transporter (DMT)-like permease